MNLYIRTILILFLMIPSFSALSCMGGLEAGYLDYAEKSDYSGEVLCGYDSSCNFEDLMNEKYGKNNWEYDDAFYIKYPELFENSTVVPISTGTIKDTLAKEYSTVSIIVEGKIKLTGEGGGSELQIVEVAKYNFSKKTFLYAATRLNLAAVPNTLVNIYAVYTNNSNKKVKVAKPPHLGVGYTGCTFYYYLKYE